jgi:sortase (surface protein transpeptidase)
MAETTHAPAGQAEANKSAKERQDKATKDAEAQVKATQEDRAKLNAETMERQDKSKPTPTQEENDKAVAGVYIEEHEYDGSPPQGKTPEETAAAAKHYKVEDKQSKPSGGAPYQTRAASPRS